MANEQLDAVNAFLGTKSAPRTVGPCTTYTIHAGGPGARGIMLGTLLVADFAASKDPEPSFVATLAAPSFATAPGWRTESRAVREIADQVRAVLDQITTIADNLEREGR